MANIHILNHFRTETQHVFPLLTIIRNRVQAGVCRGIVVLMMRKQLTWFYQGSLSTFYRDGVFISGVGEKNIENTAIITILFHSSFKGINIMRKRPSAVAHWCWWDILIKDLK